MTKLRWTMVAAAFSLIAFAPAARAGKGGKAGNPPPHEVAVFFEVEFADPMAWDCDADDDCLTCQNVTGTPSNVVVAHAPTGTEETHAVASGAELRICGNVIFLPHDK